VQRRKKPEKEKKEKEKLELPVYLRRKFQKKEGGDSSNRGKGNFGEKKGEMKYPTFVSVDAEKGIGGVNKEEKGTGREDKSRLLPSVHTKGWRTVGEKRESNSFETKGT